MCEMKLLHFRCPENPQEASKTLVNTSFRSITQLFEEIIIGGMVGTR